MSRGRSAMISDGVTASFLVLALMADTEAWREAGDWRLSVGCFAIQAAAAAVWATVNGYRSPRSEEGSSIDAERGTARTERGATRAA